MTYVSPPRSIVRRRGQGQSHNLAPTTPPRLRSDFAVSSSGLVYGSLPSRDYSPRAPLDPMDRLSHVTLSLGYVNRCGRTTSRAQALQRLSLCSLEDLRTLSGL
ncbi:hypothetical protein EVAR_82977_1 [Eumeta japonica]|uniref:Uncharacterized protein n=1 Tax=Eumeta variegata TaxID=151549 RepID=A0A4C1VRL7_EUMVA|nr:hypothetical protein EVAR_82977_1 [Eumeta japonica]